MTIRSFQPADAKPLATLIQRDLEEVNTDYAPAIIKALTNLYTAPNLTQLATERDTYVAKVGDKPVGIIALADNTAHTLFVDPHYHKQGIGSALMAHIERVARGQGCPYLELHASTTAFDFYRKRGYTEIERHHSPTYGATITMRKAF
jgi:putative acetyltransferase